MVVLDECQQGNEKKEKDSTEPANNDDEDMPDDEDLFPRTSPQPSTCTLMVQIRLSRCLTRVNTSGRFFDLGDPVGFLLLVFFHTHLEYSALDRELRRNLIRSRKTLSEE